MALHVAILTGNLTDGAGSGAAWGSWGLHSWHDSATLAADPQVLAPDTSEVLVLASSAGAPRAHIVASAIAAVRPEIAVCVETRPVSTGVLLRALESVTEVAHGPTSVHAGVCAALEAARWGAWLPTVAKLERPHPTLRQHAQSWFSRGAGFLALHGAPGWVAKLPLTQVHADQRLPRADHESHSFGQLPESAIETLFALGLGARPVLRAAHGDAAEIWGTPKAVEFVITRPGASQLGPPAGYCAVCSEPLWSAACPFCRATTPRQGRYSNAAQGVTR